jgi:hypothetical protein
MRQYATVCKKRGMYEVVVSYEGGRVSEKKRGWGKLWELGGPAVRNTCHEQR